MTNPTGERHGVDLLVTRDDEVVVWKTLDLDSGAEADVSFDDPAKSGDVHVYLRVGDRRGDDDVSPRRDADCVALHCLVGDEIRYVTEPRECCRANPSAPMDEPVSPGERTRQLRKTMNGVTKGSTQPSPLLAPMSRERRPDHGSPVQEAYYNRASDGPLVAFLAELLADLEDVEPTDLDPLHESIDVELLERFLESADPSPTDGAGVRFSASDWDVVVRSDGRITVHDPGTMTAEGSRAVTGDD